MRERRVEAAFTSAVKAKGGWALKLLPSVSGLPDRLVLFPGGRVLFVELKSPTGTVEPHQTVIHRRLRELGFTVDVVATLDAVAEWADSL